MTSPHLIGISGKIGSGKNYLATKLNDVLIPAGFTTGEVSFAIPLKNEASVIISRFLTLDRSNPDFSVLSNDLNISENDLAVLYSFTSNEIRTNPNLNGWTRSEGVRRTLQYLGTEIRRKQDTNYWVNLLSDYIPEGVDFVFVTDARFPNEAQNVLDRQGTLIRIEVPEEVILSRTSTRDGLKYSKEALAHDSEKALDDFEKFDLIIGEQFDANEIVSWIIERSSNSKHV